MRFGLSVKKAEEGAYEEKAYDLFREAMSWFEKAEAIRPTGNDEALLRWNTCARIIERNKLVPCEEEERTEFPLE